MTNSTRKWLRAGIETFIHGGAAAVGGGVGAAAIDSINFGLCTAKSWKLMGSCFLVNGMLRFFQWWSNNPLPMDSNPPFPIAPAISLNPLAKVQTIAPQPPAPGPEPAPKP